MQLLVILTLLAGLIAVGWMFWTRRPIGPRGHPERALRLLGGACDAYKNDHEQYPPSSPAEATAGLEGRHNLVTALTGYQKIGGKEVDDGAEGLGFRLPTGSSRIWGPYRGCEMLKTAPDGTNGPLAFVDPFGNPIYYYRWTGTGYDPKDNAGGPAELNGMYSKNARGDYFRKDFLLFSKGKDERWPDQVLDEFDSEKDAYDQRDDITNFLQVD